MIPATVASEVQRTIIDYLLTTFNFQEEALTQGLQRFMTAQLFQGPYLDLRLPFRRAASAAPLSLTITPPFPPYAHQVAAFARLTSAGDHAPEPTLVTTGTGSGKTECFLYPILDHCYRHRREPGIKAIILYPMNALASDQAGRLAELLWRDSRLKGQLTAGIYIGGDTTTPRKSMGPTWLIDDHATLRQSPPDILLTNYKMLDFLLLRPEDKPLWAKNGPTTLRYLVLDELHTYDGAQGADVAGLIRRLKARLTLPAGTLCPVGTSATVGGSLPQPVSATVVEEAATAEVTPDPVVDGDTTPPTDPLLTFASAIFGESFPPASIIREDRYTLAEFLAAPATHFDLPADVTTLVEEAGEPYAAYIARLAYTWFGDAVPLSTATSEATTVAPYGLGELLKSHSFLRALLAATRGQIVPWTELCQRVAHQDADFATLATDDQKLILQSFLALIAHARTVGGSPEQPRPAPLLTLQVQLWLRELSGLLRLVQVEPAFAWRADQPEGASRTPGRARTLPAYYCRECGHSGWLGLRREGDTAITDEPRQIYDAYFNRSRHICYLYLDTPADQLAATQEHLCPGCLNVSYSAHCRTCKLPTLPVVIHKKLSQPRGATRQGQDLQSCPRCQTDFALSIVGAQGATLASVAISHLYTTPLNQDKKLLVFTDSVQDAAHRAAFFSARTYRFNLRTALQSALLAWSGVAAPQQGGEIALAHLTDHLLQYWRTRWQSTGQTDVEQHLVATFLPPDLADRPDYRAYMAAPPTTPIPPDLAAALRTRLAWEVIMEYGFNARIGRSLERVGSSTAYLDPTLLDPVLEPLHRTLREEIGALRNLTRTALRHFVVGLLERTRVRGGIAHPLLKRYVEEQGNWFELTKRQQPLLSPFHKQSPRFPRFLSEVMTRGIFDAYIPGSSGRNWYFDWAQRTLSPQLGVPESNDLYRMILPRLVEGGLLHRYTPSQAPIYGITQRALLVTAQTVQLHCTVCNQPQSVAAAEVAAWQRQPCLSYDCRGHYDQVPVLAGPERHYYQALYNRGQVERIFAQEHTGLLTRPAREALEQAFKSQSQADAANLLTATPTLEMGIDIGDLSATMAAAVPPTTANYLQRIGRAGRQTGNALIMTLAGSRPHDLYFYSEPLDMIAAPVTPPGVFLNAPNMLKRHWLAFCLDHWNLSHSLASALPRNVQALLARYRHGGFPTAFLVYYASAKTSLLDRFLQQYQTVIKAETVALLQQYAAGEAVPEAIQQAIATVEAERDALRTARAELQREAKKIESDPAQFQEPDARLQELNQEMQLLADLLRKLEENYILNFFTDAGLLPNYAFPEEGVTLRAVVTGLPVTQPEDKHYVVYEYLRAAGVALQELAPYNTFYAQGRKLIIDRVAIPGRDQALERWQFCDRCSHLALVQTSHYSKVCPACGSPGWSDLGQQQTMVRLHQVGSTGTHHGSQIGDDDDERDRERYQIVPTFTLDPALATGAHLIPGLPFGFEYFTAATLHEVNFGLTATPGQKVQIAGEERPAAGFRICRDCGAVPLNQEEDEEKLQIHHAHNCPVRLGKRTVEWETIYLYRTLTSEALRLLLPVSTTMADEKLATFAAALQLGLRLHLGGAPDHLRIVRYSEMGMDNVRRHYLMIYDTVPGGTSYLRDLAQPIKLHEVLHKALAALVSCECRHDPEKAACYRCLYSYADQQRLALMSRKLGIELLQAVLSQWTALQATHSLADADLHSVLESELEVRFVTALGEQLAKQPKAQWQPLLYNGKPGWRLTLDQQQWIVEPQVLLDTTHGVGVSSRADFVCWPQGSHTDGRRPVAIFTDGYAYHVQPNKVRGEVGDDLHKRRALVASGRFWVWSLTWDDVEEYHKDERFSLPSFIGTQPEKLVATLAGNDAARLLLTNGVQQLLAHLANPTLTRWQTLAQTLPVGALLPPRPPTTPAIIAAKVDMLCNDPALPNLSLAATLPSGSLHYAMIEHYHLAWLATLEKSALQQKLFAQVQLVLRLEDNQQQRSSGTFKQGWRWFWLFHNLLQFTSSFRPVTAEYVRYHGGAAAMPTVVTVSPPITGPRATDGNTAAWQEAFGYSDGRCRPLLEAVQAATLPPPTPGYELADARGRITAQAELAWAAVQIAVLLPDQMETANPAFTAAGWQCFTLDDTATIIASYKAAGQEAV